MLYSTVINCTLWLSCDNVWVYVYRCVCVCICIGDFSWAGRPNKLCVTQQWRSDIFASGAVMMRPAPPLGADSGSASTPLSARCQLPVAPQKPTQDQSLLDRSCSVFKTQPLFLKASQPVERQCAGSHRTDRSRSRVRVRRVPDRVISSELTVWRVSKD